jgi:osmotically-inducible protein OsmY
MKTIYVIAFVAVLSTLVMTSVAIRAADKDGRIESVADKDERIESVAKHLYVLKTFMKGDDITIKSNDGIVTLTGTVADEPRRLLAQEAIGSISGVKSVNNKLETKAEQSAEKSNIMLAVKVKTFLLLQRRVSGIKTDVSAKDGLVTLRGEAINQAQKQLTTEYAKDVEGVKDVANEMTIAKIPSPESTTIGEAIDDSSITAQIKISLLFHHSTRVLQTQVSTVDGVVTLSGMAKNIEEKELVSKLVNDINGVTKVNNQMTIEIAQAK